MPAALIHAFATTIALLLFCTWFPATSSVAAFIVQSAPIFGLAFITAALVSRTSLIWWWQVHVRLRGVGSKSGWQATRTKKESKK